MSIEENIQDLTAAITRLADVIIGAPLAREVDADIVKRIKSGELVLSQPAPTSSARQWSPQEIAEARAQASQNSVNVIPPPQAPVAPTMPAPPFPGTPTGAAPAVQAGVPQFGVTAAPAFAPPAAPVAAARPFNDVQGACAWVVERYKALGPRGIEVQQILAAMNLGNLSLVQPAQFDELYQRVSALG